MDQDLKDCRKNSCSGPLFIMGLPRSGTTALAKSIATLDDFFIPHVEGHIMYWLLEGIKDALNKSEKTYQAFHPSSILHNKGNFEKLLAWVEAAIDGFEKEVGGQRGKRWIEKTPDIAQIRMMPTLQRVFRSAKFIFVYRHPRDQVQSQRRTHNPDRSDADLLRYWVDCLKEYRTMIRPMIDRGRLLEIRQEDIIVDPHGTAEQIGRLLCLSIEDSGKIGDFLARQSVNRTRKVEGMPRVSQYAGQVTPEFVYFMNALCKDEMTQWGYSINEAGSGKAESIEEMPAADSTAYGHRPDTAGEYAEEQGAPQSGLEAANSVPAIWNHSEGAPKVDIVMQATGVHGWNISDGWINAARKLKRLHRVFCPKSDWGDLHIRDDDGLFEYLAKPQADLIILLGFDWHSQMLHASPRWQERWNNSKIVKVLYIHESIEDNCRLFENDAMKKAVASAAGCVDAIVYNDYTDRELLEKLHDRVMWQPFGIDDSIFKVRKKIEDRIGRAFFRGKTASFVGSTKTYEQRRRLVEFLQEKNAVDLLQFTEGPVTGDDLANDFNKYRIALNFPTLGHNFPSRVYEAMSCGCALVTNRTGIPQHDGLFTDGKHVMYYSTREEMLEKVVMLMKNRDLAYRIASEGGQYVHKNFTLEKLTADIITWIDNHIPEIEKRRNMQRYISPGKLADRIVIDGVIFQLQKQRPAGIYRVWISLLEQLAKSEISNEVLLLDRGGTAPFIKGIRRREIDEYDAMSFERDAMYLQDICKEENAVLFISTYYTYPENTHSLLMLHDMIPEIKGMDLAEEQWRAKAKAIDRAGAYLSVSEATKNDFRKIYPNYADRMVYIVSNAVSDAFRPHAKEDTDRFKREHGIRRPYFLLSGSRMGYKNAALFFRAFSLLENRKDFEIFCTGGAGELEETFHPFVGEVKYHVKYLSDIDLSIALSGAVALVYPSQYEGFGLPVLEAMSSGCPVITCTNSSLPEVAGEAALFVDEHDVGGMLDALKKIQNPELRESLLDKGFENSKRYSWEISARNLIEAVRETRVRLKGASPNPSDPINTSGQIMYLLERNKEDKTLLNAMEQIKRMFFDRTTFEEDALVSSEKIISHMNGKVFDLMRRGSGSNVVDPFWYYWLGLALTKRKLLKEAFSAFIKSIKRFLKIPGYKWRVAFLAAEVAYRIGEHAMAWELLTQFVLKEYPNYNEAQQLLKLLENEMQSGRAGERQAHPRVRSGGPDIRQILKDIHRLTAENRSEQAMEDVSEALKRYPDSPDLMNVKGELMFHSGDIEGAVAAFTELVRRWPTYGTALNNLGAVQWHAGDTKSALKHFSAALKVDPENRDAVYNLGNLLMSLNNTGEARGLYASYLSRHPDDDEMSRLMKVTELKLGEEVSQT